MILFEILGIGIIVFMAFQSYGYREINKKLKAFHLIGLVIIGYQTSTVIVGVLSDIIYQFDELLKMNFVDLPFMPKYLNITLFIFYIFFNISIYLLCLGIAFRKKSSLLAFKKLLAPIVLLDTLHSFRQLKYLKYENEILMGIDNDFLVLLTGFIFSVSLYLLALLFLNNRAVRVIYE